MSSLSATQSDGYYLPPEYFESGAYKKVSRNAYAAKTESSKNGANRPPKVGHNQWLKHGVVRFELPEKAVCLGCKTSIGRGTRFNARKLKTDQSYFTTPIFEFRLSCRNCKEPWVIRTDPKERGFEYVSGVKRQAGQERNLVEASLGNDDTAVAKRSSLDRLEATAVQAKRTKVPTTELEELEALVTLNQKASADGRDVDHNASIRKSFRTDRRETRKRLLGATGLGWRTGMALLPSNDSDVLASKETCYGRAKDSERSKLSGVRKSSIFGSHQPRRTKQRTVPSNRRDERTSLPAPDGVRSGGTSSPLPVRSSSPSSALAEPPVTARTIRVSQGGVAVVVKPKEDPPKTSNTAGGTKPSISLLELVGAYGSSDDDDEDEGKDA